MGRDGGLLHTRRVYDAYAARPRCCRSLGRVARRDRLIFRGCERCCKRIGDPIGPMELETHANGRQDAAHV